jgi:hypothetical protein
MTPVADRFFAAIRTLTGDGPVKQRLIDAYVQHLECLPGQDLPEIIRPRFEALRTALNAATPTEKETSVQVSVRKMSQADAARLVRSILAMFSELVRVNATGERLEGATTRRPPTLRPVVDGGIRVPAFLARSSGV